MFKRLTPFFNVDGASEGSDLSGDWMSLAQGAMNEEAPADDVQPEADTDAETLETAEESEAPAEETPDETPEEPTPTFNDETEIEMGDGRQPVKLAELKAGFLRQSDYTKKTQELAAQRKEVETLQQELGPTKEWRDFIESNPWLFQQINDAINEFQTTGILPLEDVLQDAQYGKYVNHLLADNKRLQRELDTLNGEYEGVKLTAEMTRLQNDLKAEYGDLVTDEYISTLQERGKAEKLSSATLKEIADGHLSRQKLQQAQQEVKTAPKKAAAKAVQNLAETRKSLPPQPGSHAQVPSNAAPDLASMDWLQIAKLAGQR